MAKLDYSSAKALILDIIQEYLKRAHIDPKDLNDETDLLLSGILDSFAFLDLIAEVDQRTGVTIDIAQLDEKSLSNLGGFIREVVLILEKS